MGINEQILPFAITEKIDRQVEEIVEKAGPPEGGLMIFTVPNHEVSLANIGTILGAGKNIIFLIDQIDMLLKT